MAVENLRFLGINRALSDYSSSSACEEIINLRPSGNGLIPVKPFSVKMSNVSFQKIFPHVTPSGTNYIAISYIAPTLEINLVTGQGALISTLKSITVPASVGLTTDDVHFAYAGNIVLFSICKKTSPSFYANVSFRYENGSYVELSDAVPALSPVIGSTVSTHSAPANITSDMGDSEIESTLLSAINQILEENAGVCFGAIIIALAFKTKDGQTFWTNSWMVHDPTLALKADATAGGAYMTSVNQVPVIFQQEYTDSGFFATYGGGWSLKALASSGNIALPGTQVTLTIPQVNGWNENRSILESVEVYASKPVPYINTSSLLDGLVSLTQTQGDYEEFYWYSLVPETAPQDMELSGQLLYHQASVSLESLSTAAQTVTLQFGGNLQVTSDTLDVDAGMVTRYGKLLAYNARFHFYDSLARTNLEIPSFVFPHGAAATVSTKIFIQYNDGQNSGLYCVGTAMMSSSPARMVIAPTLKVTEVVTLFYYGSNWYITTYSMMPSTTYNFSISAGTARRSVGSTASVASLNAKAVTTSLITDEPSAINVTEQYNAQVFRVEHSYLAPGAVLDVQPQMAHDKDDSYGGYPLNVFTNRGLYALLQGSANVLYGAFQSLSNLVTESNSVSTEMGTFFLASGGLWLIAGRTAVLISEALLPGPHKYIRANTAGYGQLCNNSSVGYDVSAYESAVDFEEYVSGATLSYNRFRDELYVSNPAYSYSYALSLKYRQWFKIGTQITQDVVGAGLAKLPGTSPGTFNIVDFETETASGNILFHVQSRPFSFAFQYAHVHRIVSMLRANLTTGGSLIVALYGSDDLQDWWLLTYASRSTGKLSQIRTAPAARSWRYYTVTIGGSAPADTDLGPVLVDYERVIRRIG